MLPFPSKICPEKYFSIIQPHKTARPGVSLKRVRKSATRPPSKLRKNSESSSSAKTKESIAINAEAVEMHLKQLNGLNRPGSNRSVRNDNRSSPAYKPETPEHSFQPISDGSKVEASLFQEKDLFEERTFNYTISFGGLKSPFLVIPGLKRTWPTSG